MKLSVIGCGYLGTVHAAALAALGHDVVGVDTNARRVSSLNSGRAPFHEPGLNRLLRRGLRCGKLRFTADFGAVATSEVHFITVGTPELSPSGAADLTFVEEAVDMLIPSLRDGSIVAGKSTVPVGTSAMLAQRIEVTGAQLVWNPEFLREGHAVDDALHPDRVVIGARSAAAGQRVAVVYREALDKLTPLILTDWETAELVKVAANAFLATKISFINAVSEIADAAGGDIRVLAAGMGLDTRIGPSFLGAGIGFGGGCLPKDVRAFAARATELGAHGLSALLDDVDDINVAARRRIADQVRLRASPGDRIAVLGLTFKPDSDDVRHSPALDLARGLFADGFDVVAYDPVGMAKARATVPELTYASGLEEAIGGAVVVIIATEWEEFRTYRPSSRAAGTVIDARNCLDRERWTSTGWTYVAPGRGTTAPSSVVRYR